MSDDEQAIGTIHGALDGGMNMVDTTDVYGDGHNEMLARRAIATGTFTSLDKSDFRQKNPARRS